MWSLLRSTLKWLVAGIGVLVILLAIALGGFRLLATRLPSYQQDLQAWAEAELGLQLRFDRIDLRWALGGPELTFYDPAIAGDKLDEPFVFAREATVALDPIALVANRRLAARRLSIEGVRLTIVRETDGRLQIGGAPDNVGTELDFGYEIPRDVQLVVRDSEILYDDRMLGVLWPFEDVGVDVEQGQNALSMSVRASPPLAVGSHLELTIDGVLDQGVVLTDGWRGFLTIRDADLTALPRLWPSPLLAGLAGGGDVSAWLDVTHGEISRLMLDVALKDFVLPHPGADDTDEFDDLSLTAEWTRSAAGWQLALDDVRLSRDGRAWPRGGNSILRADSGARTFSMESDFLRLEDLTPILRRLPETDLRQRWLDLAPRGELRNVSFAIDSRPDTPSYELAAEFAGLAVRPQAGVPGFSGLTGNIRADEQSGTLSLSSFDSMLAWPAYLDAPLNIEGLTGVVLWRRGRSGLRIVTDNLDFRALDADVSTNVELTLPQDGGSPHIDLVTHAAAFDVLELKRYMPRALLPEAVASWLDRGIVRGRVDTLDLSLYGNLDEFPFDSGDGQLRMVANVHDGVIDYIEQWPVAEDLAGTIEIRNAQFHGHGSGRVFGNVSENVDVAIDDMRDAVFRLEADTVGPLGDFLRYLNEAPPIAEYLGPSYELLSAPSGVAALHLNLGVPLPADSDYELSAELGISDGELAVAGFPPHATDIAGQLRLRDGVVTGEDIAATFLDGPVVARVVPATVAGYRAQLDVDGEVTAEAVLNAFGLTNRGFFAGQTLWQGSLLLPREDKTRAQSEPVLIRVGSNLSGVALKFPEPFAKPPGDPTNLQLEFEFAADGGLSVAGNLGAMNRFVIDYVRPGDAFEFERGTLTFGGDVPELPARRGLALLGSLSKLDVSEWLDLNQQAELTSSSSMPLARAELDVSELSVFGQQLGATRVTVEPVDGVLDVDVDSEAVAGHIRIPRNLSDRPTITAQMSRLRLQTGRSSTGLGGIDPRKLPGLSASIEDFELGVRRLGAFEAELQPDPMGLRLVSFSADTEHYSATGSGAWFEGASGAETRLAASLSADNVAGTLADLGFDPIIEGKAGELTASVYWPGAPADDWIAHLSGDIGLHVEDGTMLDIDPGAGRVVGLMSVMALPRRLALDFRDVFNKGFAFDEISGDFAIIDGNAYTDNLKLSGPAAEIGVVGRTGLRDRDFQQQAVVTAEPSNMLPTVGGLIAGPGVGAALLIFTRIFKEPLKGIGRAAYCITGSWDEPTVDRLTAEQLSEGQLCAALPPGAHSLANASGDEE